MPVVDEATKLSGSGFSASTIGEKMAGGLLSTSSAAGSTFSKFGGSLLTKINSVPFSLSPAKALAAAEQHKSGTKAPTNGHDNWEATSNSDGSVASAEVSEHKLSVLLEANTNWEASPKGSMPTKDVPTPPSLSQLMDDSDTRRGPPPLPEASSSPRSSKPSTSVPSSLLYCDIKAGRAVAPPSIIFRYPDNIDPPTNDVCNFCLPTGSALQAIAEEGEDSAVLKEILYPRATNQAHRSLVFWFEDRNCDPGSQESEKLYGICLITPRLLTVETPTVSKPVRDQRQPSSDDNQIVVTRQQFIVYTCYVFITRYPFFDFFFRVLQDILAAEKLSRMEQMALRRERNNGSDPYFDPSFYVPSLVLTNILERLAAIKVPSLSSSICFQPHDDLPVFEYTRKRPRYGWSEHDMDVAEWCLPSLFCILPVEIILWSLSLLLCEAKFIVVSKQPGLISIVANALQYLLRPLEWAGPFIPIMPTKMVEFIESPVPIIGGVPVDSNLRLTDLLHRCRYAYVSLST